MYLKQAQVNQDMAPNKQTKNHNNVQVREVVERRLQVIKHLHCYISTISTYKLQSTHLKPFILAKTFQKDLNTS